MSHFFNDTPIRIRVICLKLVGQFANSLTYDLDIIHRCMQT